MPPNTPQANASPLGCTCVARENKPPDRKGPTALPAAERVCARPFKVPRTAWLGAEFVIWLFVSNKFGRSEEVGHTNNKALVSPPTAATVLIRRTKPSSIHNQTLPDPKPNAAGESL